MEDKKELDALFEQFKEHCRDEKAYNLTSLDDILAEFNRWRRQRGSNPIEGTTKEEESELSSDIIGDIMNPDDDAADENLDDE